MKKPNVAVVGASGLVGSTFLKVLEERDFPIENLYVMSSYRSAGKTVKFKGQEYVPVTVLARRGGAALIASPMLRGGMSVLLFPAADSAPS